MNIKLLKSAVLLVGVILLSACNQSLSKQVEAVKSNSQNVMLNERSYVLALPQNYRADKNYKLLLAFHGSGGSGKNMQNIAAFERLSDDYIVVYPNAKVEEWNDGCQCNKTHRLGINDLDFVDKLIVDVTSRHSVDIGQIYAAGFSQGGLFAQNLLCNRSEVFKGIASVASPMSVQLSESCKIQNPTSYMMVHGKKDNVLPFKGMKHQRFGLISAKKAIGLLAKQNGSLAKPLIKNDEKGVELSAYWNGSEKTHLYAIEQGAHHWTFDGFDTSNKVLDFFASSNTPELPKYSQLVTVDDGRIHVRTMGEQAAGEQRSKPTIVLLSGPNKYFHADSAWFVRVQQQLAKQYKVRAIDRPGNGWSDFDETTSYVGFVDKLYQTLVALDETEVIFVTFSSGNTTASLFEKKYSQNSKIKLEGMVWIDPDIFLPHSIAMYQDYPVTFYRKNLAKLMPHLETGAWTERTMKKLVAEREEIQTLTQGKSMDWGYYDAISQQRLLIDRQQTRSLEIAHYHDDLNAVANLDLIEQIPVSVIDSDFELEQIKDSPDKTATMTQWMEEGTVWAKLVARKSKGQYIEVSNAHHLVPLQHPDVIVDAVKWLTGKL